MRCFSNAEPQSPRRSAGEMRSPASAHPRDEVLARLPAQQPPTLRGREPDHPLAERLAGKQKQSRKFPTGGHQIGDLCELNKLESNAAG